MDKHKSENLSALLAVIGVILIILPFMGVFAGQRGSVLLTGFFCVMSSFLVRGLGKD
jgi:hypothetical protein